jgi:hypothetical protein
MLKLESAQENRKHGQVKGMVSDVQLSLVLAFHHPAWLQLGTLAKQLE